MTRWFSTEVNKQTVEEKQNSGEAEPPKDHRANEKLTTKERLKVITTQYGAFGMAFHITISLASLGMFYFLVYSGIDFAPLMTWLGMENSKVATGTSTFVVAYAVHKVFAPVRIGITFVSVPFLVKHFRKIGLFKK